MRTVLFCLTKDDEPYLAALKSIIGGRVKVKLSSVDPTGFYEAVVQAKSKGCSAIATTNPKLLKYLLGGNQKDELPSLDDYAGSIIEKAGFEFLILHPLQQLFTVSYGRFLAERYWLKLIDPDYFMPIPEFSWELYQPGMDLEEFDDALAIAADIETDPELFGVITCCGFSAAFLDGNNLRIRTIVIPFISTYHVAAARSLLAGPAPKIFQNGGYDIAHLLLYSAPPHNYFCDTLNMLHAWFAELPKDLASIMAFALRKWQYWKDEAKTLDIMTYYQYNAKDCFATVVSFMALLAEMPDWALANLKQSMPVNFPNILAENTGIRADLKQFKVLKAQLEVDSELKLNKLRTMLNAPGFNPRSPPQMQALFKILGSEDIKSADKIHTDKVMARHPLNKRILTECNKYKEEAKLLSSYLEEEKLIDNRITYSLSSSGTDTGRNASKSSRFSRRKKIYGYQIHNIPRDKKDIQIKSAYISDPGFYFGEADYSQNEARGTGYLSGDLRLIEAVEGDRDYHGLNAERFFGVPYESIIDASGKTIDKDIRDLSKRTNHGSNYNMGPGVLLDTMGIENVIRARRILRLTDGRTLEQARYTLKQTCAFMLAAYEAAYPVVKKDYYDKVKADVRNTRMLVGPTGWTRWCFGNPDKNKRDLNSYVAHPSQSLGAMQLNIAFIRVMINVWLPNPRDFKLLAQIHDSILFQYRIGREDLAWQVADNMRVPLEVRDTFGITRTLVVPVDVKGGAARWSETKTLERIAA